MIRFFKTIQPAALLSIPVAALVLWSPAFFFLKSNDAAFDSLLLNWIPRLPDLLQWGISVSLVAFGGIYLNQVVNRHEVIFRHTFIPALFYVVLMSFHHDAIQFHPLLVSNIVLIRALDKTFSLFKNESPVRPIFESGFLLAVATLIYFPSFMLFLLFLYAIYSLRSFVIREYFIALAGFVLPYYFLAVYCFMTDTLVSSSRHFFEQFTIHKIYDSFRVTGELTWFIVFLSILVLFAVIRWRADFYRNTIKARASQELISLVFVFSILGLFFLPRLSIYHFTQLAIPLSVFLAYLFISAKKRLWMYEAAFWMLLVLIGAGYV